jgi:hypothetical protein
MLNNQDVDRVLREFGIVFSTKNSLSQIGGLKIFLELLRKAKLRQRLQNEFGE